jgi:uncharacterized Ntn-hydrolase superfamily protein
MPLRTPALAGLVLAALLPAAPLRAQLVAPGTPPASTFSILAYDSVTGELGAAVQSRVFSVGKGVIWGEASVGLIATQAYVNAAYGPRGLELLGEGYTPEQVLARLLAEDADPQPVDWPKNGRQVAVMDARGNSAAHTGEAATWEAGHRTARHVSVQGNLLVSPHVLDEMVRAFQRTTGHISLRLMAALDAGQAQGGDRRGMQSAAMLVVKKDGGVWLNDDVVLRLQVDDSPEPLAELRRLLELAARQRGPEPRGR